IYLSSSEEGGRVLVMTAFDRSDGSVSWQRRVDGEAEDGYVHRAARPAQPTPCTDGGRVFFHFGGYGLITCDVESGEIRWEKRFPFTERSFGTGSSPVVIDDAVLLVKDGGDDGALWCFDAYDGEVRWKAPRPGLRHGYASPFAWRNRERTEVVVPGTNSLRSYDVEDGRLLWWVDDLCVFPCTTPVGDGERLYFAAWATPNADSEEQFRANFWGDLEITDEQAEDPAWFFERFDENGDGKVAVGELPDSRGRDAFRFVDRDEDGFWTPEEYKIMAGLSAPGRNLMVAVEAGRDGALSEGEGVLWTVTKALPYVPSPLLVKGRLYLVKSGGVVTCLDAETGEAIFGPARCGVSGEYYASPVAWGDRVLLCAQRGMVLVLDGSDELNVLAVNEFGEEIYATPAIVDGVLYLRSAEHLWAIGSVREQ
ncbi:MAG: PQQ-binding-like beta-propeller repeat protein, partial [Verrucomicrobiota bacterium]